VSWRIGAVDRVKEGVGFMDVRFWGVCGSLWGNISLCAATVLCECGRMFQLVYCALLAFVVVCVVWNVSMIIWSRGLVSPVLCSGMRCPLWW
jgi:hypothetical protein